MELKVTPLPSKGRPAGFSGLVGQFRITSKLEPRQIHAGDSATLTVYLKGIGNVTRMPDLAIPEISNTKVYDDQPVVEVVAGENGLVGSKTMKWALVPGQEGQYEVPSLSVSFFDPKVEQYKVIQTPPTLLTVTPIDEKQILASPGARDQKIIESIAKQEVKALGHDILPIHTSVRELDKGAETRPTGLFFWGIFISPPLLFGLVFCGKKMQRKAESDRAVIKARKAVKAFAKSCRRDGFRSNDLAHAARVYLNDRLGLSLGALTPNEAYDILTSRGVSSDTAKRLKSSLQSLENAIYTGQGEDASSLGKEITGIIKCIDKEIR